MLHVVHVEVGRSNAVISVVQERTEECIQGDTTFHVKSSIVSLPAQPFYVNQREVARGWGADSGGASSGACRVAPSEPLEVAQVAEVARRPVAHSELARIED